MFSQFFPLDHNQLVVLSVVVPASVGLGFGKIIHSSIELTHQSCSSYRVSLGDADGVVGPGRSPWGADTNGTTVSSR